MISLFIYFLLQYKQSNMSFKIIFRMLYMFIAIILFMRFLTLSLRNFKSLDKTIHSIMGNVCSTDMKLSYSKLTEFEDYNDYENCQNAWKNYLMFDQMDDAFFFSQFVLIFFLTIAIKQVSSNKELKQLYSLKLSILRDKRTDKNLKFVKLMISYFPKLTVLIFCLRGTINNSISK